MAEGKFELPAGSPPLKYLTTLSKDGPISIALQNDGKQRHGETIWMPENFALLSLGYICIFDQSREGENPVQASITESLGKMGLINLVDVVRITREAVDSYAQFVSDLWGGEKINTSTLPQSTFESGMYDVLVAGHSRIIGVKENEAKKAEYQWAIGNTDYDPALSQTMVKIHPVTSNRDMINIQMTENIHKALPEEREAVTIVENYYLGLRDGLWSTPEQFQAEFKDKVNIKKLIDAMAFAKLPTKIRELVFTKIIPYSVGILLGNYSDILYEFNLFKYFSSQQRDMLSIEEKEILDYNVESELMMEATKIVKSRLKYTPAKKHFSSLEKAKKQLMKTDTERPTLGDNLFEVTAVADLERNTRRLRQEINSLLDDMVDDEGNRMLKTQRMIGDLKQREPRLNRFLEGLEKITSQTRATIELT
jgi:hypothetical protein